MKFSTLLVLAAPAFTLADFVIVTAFPAALETMGASQANAYYSSIFPAVQSELLNLAAQSGYVERVRSVATRLAGFVGTATISIPAIATQTDAVTIYTSTPPWFTALPQDVQVLYEEVAERIEGVLREAPPVIASATISSSQRPSPSSSGEEEDNGDTSSTPSPPTFTATSTPTSASASASTPPESTGEAGKLVLGWGVGVAAGLVGLAAL